MRQPNPSRSRNRRCGELPDLIEQGETSEFLRPVFRFYRGVLYQFGICAPQDWSLAAKAYRSSAILGEEASQLRLGRQYLEGLGVEQDRGKAREWFKRLMYEMLGDPNDERVAWLRKWCGGGELPEILLDELAWLRRVEGDPRSRMHIAVRIMAGDGLPRDIKAAAKWLRSAANLNLPEAQLKLAHWLFAGKIERYHWTEGAMTLYKVAAAGYLPAMVEYAIRIVGGDGLSKSDLYAYPRLLRAKEAGAPVDELLPAVGSRLGNFGRAFGEKIAKDGGRLPFRSPSR